MANDNSGASPTGLDAKIKIGGEDVDTQDVIELHVHSELDMADYFDMTLGVSETMTKIRPALKVGATVEISLKHAGDKDPYDVTFRGEVTRMHQHGENRGSKKGFTELHGYNSMLGLSRGKRSKTFKALTDQQIVDQVLQSNSSLKLSGDYGKEPPKLKYDHVYQTNKSDLQFILDRAKRTGYYVLVRDKTLLYFKRDPTPSPFTLKSSVMRRASDDKNVIALEDFTPQLSTAQQVTEVIVRYWDSKNRKTIIGKAPKDSSGSGGAQNGTESGKKAIDESYPKSVLVHHKTHVDSQDDADLVAAAILDERLLSYINAEGSMPGDPRLKPGLVVNVVRGDKVFDGHYFVTRIHHHYDSHDSKAFLTEFHANRDALDKPEENT